MENTNIDNNGKHNRWPVIIAVFAMVAVIGVVLFFFVIRPKLGNAETVSEEPSESSNITDLTDETSINDEFDSEGRRIKETRYTAAGEPDGWSTFEYGSDGSLAMKKDYDEDGTLKTEEEYGDGGFIEKETDYFESGYKEVNEFDKQGLLAKMTTYDEKGRKTFLYEYDDYGRVSVSTQYYVSGNVRNVRTYEYRDNGSTDIPLREVWVNYEFGSTTVTDYDAERRKTKETTYADDGSLMGYVTYEYLSENVRRETVYNESEEIEEIVEIESISENLSRETYFLQDGSIDMICEEEITYLDDGGKTIKVTDFDPDGTAREYMIFEIDSGGNQTKVRTYWADGTPKP